MSAHTDQETVTLTRDVIGVLIPQGTKVELPEAAVAHITQSLGGSYTVQVQGHLFRIDGVDADALGKAKPKATPETALAGALKAAKAKPAKPAAAAKKVPLGPPIKYRNALTGETWTGRGLQPKWLKVNLANGNTLADFDITTKDATHA